MASPAPKEFKPKKKEAKTPITFVLPDDFTEKVYGAQEASQRLVDLRLTLRTLESSLHRHKMETQSSLLKLKNVPSDLDKVVGELEEAFLKLWPRFDSLQEDIRKGDVGAEEGVKKNSDAIVGLAGDIAELSRVVEKRYQSALKRINQQRVSEGKVEVRFDKEEAILINAELKRLEKLIKEVGKYEYGSSLNVLLAGVPIGFTGVLNFKSGFVVAINGSQIDITASPSALAIIPIAGAIDDSNKTFTYTTLPTLLNINGAFYQPTGGSYTWTALAGTITLNAAVGVNGQIFGI